MNSLFLAIIVQASLTAANADTSYTAAHREAEAGKPLVVLVSTEWCAPCQTMKKTVIPQVRRRGLLRRVAFAIVNPDRNRSLARKLTGGQASIPQLIMYRRTTQGWKRRRLVGGQSVESVEKFINEGLAADRAEKPAVGNAKDTLPPKRTATAEENSGKQKARTVSTR